VRLKMSPEEARLAKSQIRELLIGNLEAPFVGEDGANVGDATIDSPVQLHMSYHTINMQILQVWFYNATTGKIYRKLAP
jgi:hypothetical protein